MIDARKWIWIPLVTFAIGLSIGVVGSRCDWTPEPPIPPPPPVVIDIPVAVDGVHVLMLYDKEGDNDKFNDVLYGGDMEAYLNAACAKDGKDPEWRRWDDTQDVHGETVEWQEIFKAAKAKWDGKAPTAFVVVKQQVTPVSLPDEIPAAITALKSVIGE